MLDPQLILENNRVLVRTSGIEAFEGIVEPREAKT